MTTGFSSSTPIDINDRSVEDILQFVGVDGDAQVSSPKVRLNLTKMLYDVLGLTLTPDIALATVAEPRAELVLSTAGGGKTTFAQVKAILEKLMRKSVYHTGKKVRGDAILCLVYNKHNVDDMLNKHMDMIARLEARGIKGLNIDNDIHACTLHSFCDGWRREYVAKMDLLGATLLEQSQAESFMRRAIRTACKVQGCEKLINKIDPADAFSLYTYYRETMCEIKDLTDTDKFIDLNIDIALVEEIFNRYDRAKKLQGKYDFVDMLYKFYCLMRDDETVRTHIQHFYEYVIADEVQDFTPLMWEILKLMVSDGTPLTCIGDEDQNIYSFRGADIYNTLQFDAMFQGGRIYSLEFNRRCGKRILDEARKVIEMNTLRFNKVLRNTKDGGTVLYEPYNTLNGQFVNVIKCLKDMTSAELENTVVCYREGASSTILSDMLVSEDIPFNVISGVGPFSHELYRHLFEIFDALEMPYDMNNCITLYKVLPCNKDEWHQAIGYDPAKGRFTREVEKGKHFKDYNYGKLSERKSFNEAIQQLAAISALIDTRPMQDLIQPVFQMLNKYFWAFKKTCNRFPDIDEIMQARILKYFKSPLVYSKFFQEYQHTKSRYTRYTEVKEGLTVSTFHSLKGLEFDNVIVVCMDDSIFPNYRLIDSKPYSSKMKTALKEAEVRLWYVAITRAKKNLHIFYAKDNPSLFVRFALDNNFPVANQFADSELIDIDEELHQSGLTSPVPQKIDFSAFGNSTPIPEVAAVVDDLDELDDLDDFEEQIPQSREVDEETKEDQADPTDIASVLTESRGSAPKAESTTSVMWRSTDELVQESAGADTIFNNVEEESNKDAESEKDANPNKIQLRSGKSLYLNRLINSL